ncbi:MAG: NAD(P)H:quinone oxidoreductase [Nocardioidaceae bacterium]|nr:NAD(P)H:quinone oxidoreductase [Nocardioidaceae bacterium]
MTNLAVIYYSATGTLDAMARRCAQAGEKAGAEVRLRRVVENAPREPVTSNPRWQRHVEEVAGEPTATADDIVWADAVLVGTPTRYGNVASQLKAFLDSLGPQWQQGLLADKAYGAFTASSTAHGGQETTLLTLFNTICHFGGILVPPGYTDQVKFTEGNPYGVSHVSGPDSDEPLGEPQLQALDHLTERVLGVAGKLSRAA